MESNASKINLDAIGPRPLQGEREQFATRQRPGQPRAVYRHYPASATLFRQGGHHQRVYLVRDGLVKLVRHLPNGRARIVGLFGPGTLLGAPPNTTPGATNPHSAQSVGPVDAEYWPGRQLKRLRDERPERYIELLECLYEHLSQADLWIAEFSTGRIKSRVARLVLFLEQLEHDLEPGVVALLTCQDMGDILGVTPESVSRVIAGLKRTGLLVPVAEDRKEHFRCDLERLRELAST